MNVAKLCSCESCLDMQRRNKLNYSDSFKNDLEQFFDGFDIDTMTDSLRLVYYMALYESDRPIERKEKEALHQVQMLCEGLDSLGKSEYFR